MSSSYVLMHKDVEVATLEMDEDYGLISKVGMVHDLQHMPIGTVYNGAVDWRNVKDWWASRSIPASRSGLRDFLESLELYDAKALLTKSMGLSLSDQYWIRPEDSKIRWKDVNFFDNPFSEDIGDLLFGSKISGNIDMMSPDNTTDGVLRKRWKIMDGRHCLIKGSTGTTRQEPFNEVIASRLMGALGIPYVDYRIIWMDGRPYSVCEDFIDRDTEYVPAYHVLREDGRKGSESVYQRYVRICGDLGVDVVPFLDRMIVLDHIIANGDRHLNNFGLVRDADTLEWLGPAPVYDCGSSLGFDLPTSELRMHANDECKPFARAFEKQLALVSSLDWVDVDVVAPVIQDVPRILGTGRGRIDAERTSEIVSLLGDNVSRIARLAESR